MFNSKIVAFLIGLLWATSVVAQVPMTGAGLGIPASATTTWNPSDKSTNITLSGGNLIANITGAVGGSIRAIANHSTGKYFSSYVITSSSNNLIEIGMCNISYAVSGTTLGTSPNCAAVNATTGVLLINSAGVCTFATMTNGDVIDFAFNAGSTLLWFRKNGGAWLGNGGASPDPASGTNGCNISALTGAYYPAASLFTFVTTSVTANFGATAYTNAAPSGFGNW